MSSVGKEQAGTNSVGQDDIFPGDGKERGYSEYKSSRPIESFRYRAER